MERGATEENEDKPFAILCWPSELCTAPVPAGWIVGWSSSRKRSRNDSHEVIVLNEAIEEEEEWPYHAFVCAGIVPWTNNPTRTECESTLRRVRTRIGTIRDDLHRRGCSCSPQQSISCSTCVLKTCWNHLDIVGLWSPTNGGRIPSMQHQFPTFKDQKGFPVQLTSQDFNHATVQLLLYERDGGLLYRHEACPTDSFFSGTLLIRLSHALTLLQQIEATVHSPHEFRSSRIHSSDPSTHANVFKSRASIYNFRQYSLLCQHSGNLSTTDIFPIYSFMNAYNQLRGWKDNQTMSNYERAATSLQLRNETWRTLVDAILGIFLGVSLALYIRSATEHGALERVREFHYNTLGASIDWLGKSPVGFKLNERLTENLGRELHTILTIHRSLVQAMFKLEVSADFFATAVLLTGVLFGSSGFFALLHDSFRLATAHLTILATCFRRVYQAELYLLAALWRVFRGKKWNVLRLRTDSMEYDSMQLLLGTILFAVSLFMFTTVLVHHVFFAMLDLVIKGVSAILVGGYWTLHCFPYGQLFSRLRDPGWFVANVYLRDVWTASGSVCSRLSASLTPPEEILTSTLLPLLKRIAGFFFDHAIAIVTGQSRAKSMISKSNPSS